MTNPTVVQVEDYLRRTGKRGSDTIKLLAHLNHFIVAINSDIGKELLKDDVDRSDELLVKIYEENATDQEKAEFRFLKTRLKKVSERIATYVAKAQEVTNK